MSDLPSLSGLSVLASALAGAAGWLGVSGPPRLLPRAGAARAVAPGRFPFAAEREPLAAEVEGQTPAMAGAGGADALWRRLPLTVALPAVLGLAAVVVSGSPPTGLLVLVAAGVLGQRRRAAARMREQAACRASVLELCTATVAELRAGRPPRHALAAAAAGLGDAGPALSAGHGSAGHGSAGHGSSAGYSLGALGDASGLGAAGGPLTGGRARGDPATAEPHPGRWAASAATEGRRLASQIQAALRYDSDVPTLLRTFAARPGAEGLRRLAACWEVAEGSGAGLATAVDRLAASLRTEEAQRREIGAQLAGPRATARLLAVLPVFGLLLAAGLGGDPVHVLLGTPYGLACLCAGLALDAVGLLWTERIAAAAEAAP